MKTCAHFRKVTALFQNEYTHSKKTPARSKAPVRPPVPHLQTPALHPARPHILSDIPAFFGCFQSVRFLPWRRRPVRNPRSCPASNIPDCGGTPCREAHNWKFHSGGIRQRQVTFPSGHTFPSPLLLTEGLAVFPRLPAVFHSPARIFQKRESPPPQSGCTRKYAVALKKEPFPVSFCNFPHSVREEPT